MIFFKPDICFKVKTLDETVADFCKRIKSSNNSYELSILKDFLPLKEYDEVAVKAKLKSIYNIHVMQGEKQIKSIQAYWQKIEKRFFDVLNECLDLNLFGEVQTYCMLDCLPLPLISCKGKKISLPITESLDNNIRFALNHIVKYFLLKKFIEKGSKSFNFEYNRDSAYWIMADLVADSLFFHTDLKEFAHNTAYKYYYGLKIKNGNLIDYIRSIYPKMEIMDFMQYVLDFVGENIAIFSKFTNRY